ncbi:MAG: 2-oxo-4-hydroxy-4-carboxy-5-ureidoimidazoline decarboxylase [Acidobacteria bacterium]|nr:MAG: 2-oxo-4-hydroxy-4-carboxy-5-ureidoimidazoline decarboxylase [Acidobacteriota bacterium]
MLINALNALSEDAAVAELLHCCGSTRWARRMAAARPLPSFEAMSMVADRIWASLEPQDWLEAFRTHPRIGEQGGARSMTDAVGERLAKANREYEARFGYLFIVCATGKGAEEMVAILERRLAHAPGEELRIAAEEQRKIMRLRLSKLLDFGS